MTKQLFRLSIGLLLVLSTGFSQTTDNRGPNEAATAGGLEEPANQIAPKVSSGGLPYPFRYVHLAGDAPKAAKHAVQADAKSVGPRMAGSATGYIDNALVGSQIRIRFDGDFDLQNPDRAEFFYPKCGCFRAAGLDGSAPGPGTVPASKVNLQEIQVNVEYAPNRHFSFLAEVPFRFIQFTAPSPGIPSSRGIGDFRAGFKVALISGEKSALTFQFRTYFPSGNASLGLGTNHFSVEPTILYHQRFGERWTLAGEFGDWHPIGGSNSNGLAVTSPTGFAGDILLSGLGVGYDLFTTRNYRVTPIVEFVGWSILGGLATGGTTPYTGGISIVNIKVGTRVTFQGRNSIYVGYGHELTKTAWYTDIIRLEYRYAF